MAIDCDNIAQHIIEHEIIGIETTATVSGVSNLIVEDDNVLVLSGVSTLNFSEGITAINAGSGQVDVQLASIQLDQNILWVYDGSRSKWLSSFRFNPSASEKGRAKNKYLAIHDGQVTNLSGYRMVRTATITAISAQTRNIETWILRIRKNGDATNLTSLSMTGAIGNHDTTVNLDLDEGDRVQFFAETSSLFGIKDPLIWVEIAWRNDNLTAP